MKRGKLEDELEARVLGYVESNKHELLRLCSDLIRAKGENPPGDVSEPASVIEEFLKEKGIGYERLEPKPGRANILAPIGKEGRTLILCGHIDVVPAGDPKRWSFPPFCGEIRGGNLLGRGSTDMKGGLAAMLMALAAVHQVEDKLLGKVIAAAVCDEEVGGYYGARWLIEEKGLIGDCCLITEPSIYLEAGPTIDAGERGVFWLRFRALGRPCHGSWPAMGENAILNLTSFLPKLGKLENVRVSTPEDAKEIVRNGKRILARIAKQRGISVRKLTRILDHYTVNVGIIRGGTKTNVVPEECEAEVDFRIPIGGSKEEIENGVKKMLPKGIGYEVIAEAPPSYSSAEEPLLDILKAKAREVLGVAPPLIAIWATSDAWRFREKGISTATFGPGIIEKAHSYDEYVPIEDVINASKIYSLAILSYLSTSR